MTPHSQPVWQPVWLGGHRRAAPDPPPGRALCGIAGKTKVSIGCAVASPTQRSSAHPGSGASLISTYERRASQTGLNLCSGLRTRDTRANRFVHRDRGDGGQACPPYPMCPPFRVSASGSGILIAVAVPAMREPRQVLPNRVNLRSPRLQPGFPSRISNILKNNRN